VLLVGINPAPVSVAARHYYQGRLGQRLWRRLARVGLLHEATPGAEDEAFAAAGHGLTDLVKRPTPSSDLLSSHELEEGADALREKIRAWRPGLVLFAFRPPAERLLGRLVSPGHCGEIEGVPAFLLSGPYAPAAEAARVDSELERSLPRSSSRVDAALTQQVTANDLARGQVRLPRGAKRFFPPEAGELEIVLRGQRVRASYDPRLGPDRERSGVLRLGRALGDFVQAGERLSVSRGKGGIPRLDTFSGEHSSRA
jgi:TDG/mug DNA glycosylase family protein